MTRGLAVSAEAWTKTLLALVPPESGEVDAGPCRYVDAEEILRRVALRSHGRASRRNVAVFVSCASGSVSLQPERFADAIFHLLENAIEATSSGHPVFVDAWRTANGDMLWQIVDTGCGMAPAALARLGEPEVAGSGRGVALANAVVQQHRGILRFESAPGVGTTASIWLPGGIA